MIENYLKCLCEFMCNERNWHTLDRNSAMNRIKGFDMLQHKVVTLNSNKNRQRYLYYVERVCAFLILNFKSDFYT